MDAQAFTWWLQGYAEVCGKCPDEAQWAMIKEHLQLVFRKVTGTPRGHGFTLTPPFGTTEDSKPLPGQLDPFGQTYCAAVPMNGERLYSTDLAPADI